jgi:hypothetical protein
MRFWQITGTLLVLIGLYVFYQVYEVAIRYERPVSAGALVVIGIIVFRGGIHLLKVAAAAHACREYRAELRNQKMGSDGSRRKETKLPLGPRS